MLSTYDNDELLWFSSYTFRWTFSWEKSGFIEVSLTIVTDQVQDLSWLAHYMSISRVLKQANVSLSTRVVRQAVMWRPLSLCRVVPSLAHSSQDHLFFIYLLVRKRKIHMESCVAGHFYTLHRFCSPCWIWNCFSIREVWVCGCIVSPRNIESEFGDQ